MTEKVKGGWSKVIGFIVLIAPSSIAAIVQSFIAGMKISERVFYPMAGFLIWLSFWMLWAAFRRHRHLEHATDVKLSIEQVYYQYDVKKGFICKVRVRNLSSTKIAENVHVRVSGKLPANIFVNGFSPFNEPDLIPATGCRAINPNSEADWLFTDSFNDLVNHLHSMCHIGNLLIGSKQESGSDRFMITASASASAPVFQTFVFKWNDSDRLLSFGMNENRRNSAQCSA